MRADKAATFQSVNSFLVGHDDSGSSGHAVEAIQNLL